MALFSLILAVALPGSHHGVFDGLPLASLPETLTMMVGIPALAILGFRFFGHPGAAAAAFILLAVKAALWLGAPAGGMAMKIFDTPGQAARGEYKRTYDTLVHGCMSARITTPLTDGRQFPVDWLWRRDSRFTAISYPFQKEAREPHHGGHWMAVHIEAWADVPPGMKLAFVTVGAGEGKIRASSSVTGEKEYTAPAADQRSFTADQLIPSGVSKISGEFIFTLDSARHYALAPALVTDDGHITDAFAGGAVWMDEASARSSSARKWMARSCAALVDWGTAALLAWWGLWTAIRMLAREQADTPLIAWAAAGALAPFILTGADISSGSAAVTWVIPIMVAGALAYWALALAEEAGATHNKRIIAAAAGGAAGLALWPVLLHDCGGGAWTPPGLSAVAAGVVFARWLKVRSGGYTADPWQAFTLFAGLLIFPWFIWQWHGQAGMFFPCDDLSDSLTYQVFAREIWVEGDWWHAAGEPVFFYQPGYRYIAGALHAVFGQSSLAQNILELWGILMTCAAMGAIGRWAGLGAMAIAAARFFYITLLFGPHFIAHVGLGMQELTANLFLFGVMTLIARSGAIPWRMAAAGLLAVAAFWLRFDRLGVLAASIVFCVAPAGGAARTAWGAFLKELAGKWKPAAIYLGILAAGVVAVALRNLALGGELSLLYRENMDLLTCRDLACSLRGYAQIFAGSVTCLDRAGVVMIAGAGGAIAAMAIRPSFLAGTPVFLGLPILGLLAPYWVGGPTNFEPKFSMHLLPLAAICLSIIISSMLRGKRS